MKVRRAVVLFVTLALVAIAFGPSARVAVGQPPVKVLVDGQFVAFDQPPIISGSRVLVPLRGVFEKMGAIVAWDGTTQTVIAVRGDTTVRLQIGQRIAYVNDQTLQLDVPAMLVNSRTLVPLRFISESLGAKVDWQDASRTVFVWTSSQAGPPPPPPPPAADTTIRGIITSVVPAQNASDRPLIIVQAGDIAYTVRITTDTAITRVELNSGTGGSVGVAALRPGDDVEVTLKGNTPTRIRATYLMTNPSKIEAIAKAGRTLVLADGSSIKYAMAAEVVADGGQVVGIDALKPGQVVRMRLNPTTKEAWHIFVLNGAQVPNNKMKLALAVPVAGDTVGRPIEVKGSTVPGARVDIMVTWFLGLPVGRQTVTADANGNFAAKVPVSVVVGNSPYLITVTATHPALGQEEQQFTVTVV